MKKRQLILLSLLSGLLLALAWPERGFPALLFFALVPLLFLEDRLHLDRGRYHTWHALFLSYPAFFTWNVLTTWWIWNSTAFGVIMAVLFNSLFMALVFTLYHWTKRRFSGPGAGYWMLPVYWITFEFLHMRWDLTWPWLNLGNGFAAYPSWVQWYEYTGTFGGAVWIFLVNILLYMILVIARKNNPDRHHLKILFPLLFLALFVPLGLSQMMFLTYREKANPIDVVVLQPNIDPYTEQYELTPEEVLDRMDKLAAGKADEHTGFLVAPESAIQENIWENHPEDSYSFQWLHHFLRQHPHLNIVLGASTFRRFMPGENRSATARWARNGNFYYDAYNTALFMDSSLRYTMYHKSKLVVGVERMPFPKYLKFLERFALDLGGTIGSLGTSPERTVHQAVDPPVKVAAAICYESVYGEFFSEFVKNGAQLMFIITNDGWWGHSPGHRQHLSFARLRAIETRRCIARSANTGISCFVDQRGVIRQATGYWEPAVIKGRLNVNDRITLYTRYGDYLGRFALVITGLLLGAALASLFSGKKKGLRLADGSAG